MSLSARLFAVATLLLTLSGFMFFSDTAQSSLRPTASSLLRVGLLLLTIGFAYPDLRKNRWRLGLLIPLACVGLALPRFRVAAIAAAILVLVWRGDRLYPPPGARRYQ